MNKLNLKIARKLFQEDRILENVDLKVEEGEVVVVLGPSGSGKTTLLRIIAGLDIEYEGEVVIDGRRTKGPNGKTGVVFQDVRLFPWMTVERNLKFADSNSITNEKVEDLLEFVGLRKTVKKLYPRQLSGGMAKRVGLARSLANDPSLLLLDESFSELDARSKFELYESLLNYKHKHNPALAILIVTHDIDEAVYLGNRIILFGDARPTTILREFDNPLPHPRNREDPRYVELCSALMMKLISNIDYETKSH